MLRAIGGNANILTQLTINDIKCGQTAFGLEFVRWRRKPRWLPTAKSKLYRVPERKQLPPEEKKKLMSLYNNYRTEMRTIRSYFRDEVKHFEETSTKDHIVLSSEQEEEEYQKCLQLNDLWNREIATEREQRLAKERDARIAYVNERLAAAKLRHEEELEQIEARVRHEKEQSKNFIKYENLDTAIENSLANPVDYNFAIDLHGNIYRGRTGMMPTKGDDPQPNNGDYNKPIPLRQTNDNQKQDKFKVASN